MTQQNPNPPGQPNNPTKALVPEGVYLPGGLNQEAIKPIPNPKLSNSNFPFSAGAKIQEVVQYQNLFTFPLDTYYNVFDAIFYFSTEKNRNRYTYEHQQLIISRIARAAIDFGISIDDVTEKLKT
ncbi:MAG: hypothetical protein WCS37_01320 [Chloroflexota bacterium]|nr:hypothetical protein [Chloroflexota bacterium]